MSASSETEMNRITDKPDTAFPREVFLDVDTVETHCHMRVLTATETTSLRSDIKAACEAVVGGALPKGRRGEEKEHPPRGS